MPPIGKMMGGVNFTDLFINLDSSKGAFASLKAAKDAGATDVDPDLRQPGTAGQREDDCSDQPRVLRDDLCVDRPQLVCIAVGRIRPDILKQATSRRSGVSGGLLRN